MLLSVISNGNGLSYSSVTIALHSVAFVTASTYSSAADSVQIKPASPGSTSSALSLSSPAPSLSIACDMETFSPSGCEDETGSFCDSSQKCSCKDDHPIRLLGYCLKRKQIGEECYTSTQCASINNAACYIFGKEYDNERISGGHNVGRQVSNWPTGTCRCDLGHQWDNTTETCIKKTIGSWCNDDWDCIKDKYNTQCSRPQNLCECAWGYFYDTKTDSCQTPKLWGQKCISNGDCEAESFICSPSTFKCVCPSGFHFDAIHPGCKVNADSSCQRGYRWDQVWSRCIPTRPPSAVFPSLNTIHGLRTKSLSSSDHADHSGSSVHSSKPSSTGHSSSTSVTTMLILILPNVIVFALIARYCYYRKRDDDSTDLERGTFAHLHDLTKFCAYPPYTSTSAIKGLDGSCLTSTVVSYTGDMAIGTCCTVGKHGHGKSTLESVEETDEPVGSLDQETPEGEDVTFACDGKQMHKSSAATGEEHKSQNDDHSSPPSASDDDAGVICPALACQSQADSSRINSGQEDTKNSLNNSSTGDPIVDTKQSDLDVVSTCPSPLVHSTSPKVTLVRCSPNSSANKVQLELVHDCQPVIDRQSSHSFSRDKITDSRCSNSPSSSRKESPSHEQVQQNAPSS